MRIRGQKSYGSSKLTTSHSTITEQVKPDLDKVVDGLEVEEVIVAHVDTDAEVETGIPSVDDLEVPNIFILLSERKRLKVLFTYNT